MNDIRAKVFPVHKDVGELGILSLLVCVVRARLGGIGGGTLL